jgi:hypothetical protein
MDASERDNSPAGNGPDRSPADDTSSVRVVPETGETAKPTAQAAAGSATRMAADEAEETAAAIGNAAAALKDSGQAKLSEATAALASKLHGFSGYLQNRSIDDLLDDARRLAARNPGLLIAGGVVLGVAMSRFFKASLGSTSDVARRQASFRSRDDDAAEDLSDIANGEGSERVSRGAADRRATH